MPYSHGVSASVATAGRPAHLSCEGHDVNPDVSHLSDCLSQILIKNSVERATVPYDAPTRISVYRAISVDSYYLPPVATRALADGLSPPSPPLLESTPAPFISTTMLLV